MIEIKPYERDVFYYETDRMGIVHHSNYIRWMEEARVDYLKQIGLPFDEMERRGIMVPVLSVEFQYRTPARFGERFQVILTLEKFTGIKMDFSYQIVDVATGVVRGTGSSKHCFTDEKMSLIRLQKDRKDLYRDICDAIGLVE